MMSKNIFFLNENVKIAQDTVYSMRALLVANGKAVYTALPFVTYCFFASARPIMHWLCLWPV